MGDHPQRTDSAAFRAAKGAAHKILATLTEWPYGPGPWQMHHGASLWTLDAAGWFLVCNTLGSEWSGQFCLDFAKADALRLNAVRHYAGFPLTVPGLVALGYHDAQAILDTPITTPELVARFVDSIFNSCIPLAQGPHTGVPTEASPFGGQHHFPKPICDLQHLKRDDFKLWVIDAMGHPLAVVPVAARGSGDGRVEVVFAHPNSAEAAPLGAAHAKGERHILPAGHPAAVQAFAGQA